MQHISTMPGQESRQMGALKEPSLEFHLEVLKSMS